MRDQDIGFEGDAVLPRGICSLILESANSLGLDLQLDHRTHAKSDPPH
jgi:hypothetical protein